MPVLPMLLLVFGLLRSLPAADFPLPGLARLDELVLAQLRQRNLTLAPLCDDATFLRRACLDVLGTLPRPQEARAFLADQTADKRSRLVETLLRRDEYAWYWALKWGDLLRIKAEFPSNLWPYAVQVYHRWVWQACRDNKPYDQFVRELLTAVGSNFQVGPANFFRAQERTPRRMAEVVGLLFLGQRLEVRAVETATGPVWPAGWSEAQILDFSAFFAPIAFKSTGEWKEEIVYHDPDRQLLGADQRPIRPATPDGAVRGVAAGQDRLVVLADWLTAPGNRQFARAMANRVWYWLIGRGLVHDPDDFRADNPPWSQAVLDHLAEELVSHHYDIKHLFRLILRSRLYQAASGPSTDFTCSILRPLDAEVLLDAINQVLAGREQYRSQIPEPFTVLPSDQRAIGLADGSITLPVLTLFGRPDRNTPYESERTCLPSALQAQHLLNSSHIQGKLQRFATLKPVQDALAGRNADLIQHLYLLVLTRQPTVAELATAEAYLNDAARSSRAEAATDLVWALLNTSEFRLKH